MNLIKKVEKRFPSRYLNTKVKISKPFIIPTLKELNKKHLDRWKELKCGEAV